MEGQTQKIEFQNIEHPTAAAWSRWKGVKDWDS
jgi:hypothetical protein